MELRVASDPTLRRLPGYLHLLKRLYSKGAEVISCTEIAKALGLLPIQVRKDLTVTGVTGTPGLGYRCLDLIEATQTYLGWNEKERAVLVGAGDQGVAVLRSLGPGQPSLNIVAAFDSNPQAIGGTLLGFPVQSTTTLATEIRRLNIRIGILTTDEETAQGVCDLMVSAGVMGIWNFTLATLKVEPEVIIENVHLSSSLAILTTRLQERLRTPA